MKLARDALLLMALAVAGAAHADTLDVLRANTLLLRDEAGGEHVLLVKDGAEGEQINAAGMWARFVWQESDGRFCWTARGAAQACIPMPSDKAAGDTWEVMGPTGKRVWTAQIQPGRADLDALARARRAGDGKPSGGSDAS